MATAGFMPIRLVTALFRAETTSGSLFTQAVDREKHLFGVLVPEQALSQSTVEMFDNGLVAVNVNAPAPVKGFVLVHLFGDGAHEFVPGVNLRHFGPFERRALVNLLKGQGDLIRIFRSQGFGLFEAAGHVDNGQRVFENFAAARELVVRQKKKVSLMDPVGRGNVEFRPRNPLRRGGGISARALA